MELGKAPAQFQIFEASFLSHSLVSLIAAANDRKAASPLVQVLDQSTGKEACVGQEANPGSGDGGGNFVQAAFDEVPGSGVGAGISGPQRAVPELLPMTFEAEDRVVGGTTFCFGIISDSGSLLFAIES